MKYILFLMFFTSPPAPVGGQVWSLQSTSIMEFATEKGCEKVGMEIQDSVKTTDTVTVRGWCIETPLRRDGLATQGFQPDANAAPIAEPTIRKLKPR